MVSRQVLDPFRCRVEAVNRCGELSGLGRRAASRRELLRRAAHSLHGRTRERFDPIDPESAAYPAGGAVERRAYLEEVRRQSP
jgi:hypothetical protein